MSFNADFSSLVCQCAIQSYIQKTPDVTRCLLVPNQQDGSAKFVVEGFNFFQLFQNQEVSYFGKLIVKFALKCYLQKVND